MAPTCDHETAGRMGRHGRIGPHPAPKTLRGQTTKAHRSGKHRRCGIRRTWDIRAAAEVVLRDGGPVMIMMMVMEHGLVHDHSRIVVARNRAHDGWSWLVTKDPGAAPPCRKVDAEAKRTKTRRSWALDIGDRTGLIKPQHAFIGKSGARSSEDDSQLEKTAAKEIAEFCRFFPQTRNGKTGAPAAGENR